MSIEANRSSRSHRTIHVQVGNWSEQIDEEMAPLIREIWNAGVDTMMCCQEVAPGIGWIEFPSVEDLLRFLNIVTVYEPGVDTLYNRIRHDLAGTTSSPEWEFQFNLLDICDTGESRSGGERVCFEPTVGAYFPASDIPLLIERLQEFNEVTSSAGI